MSVITRLIQLTRAATGELLDKLEDPTMMMNHYVREAQAEIENVQQELQKQEAMARVLQQQADESAKLAEISENKALEALTAGNESQARDLLNSKLYYTQKSQAYTHSLEQVNFQIPLLAKRLEEAKAELVVMQKKRDDLAARVQQAAAKAQSAMPSFSHSFPEGGSASRGFQRMEEKILQWEAHLDVKRQPYSPYTDASTTAAYPAHPEKDSIIDQQMELLRKKLPTE
ncbi:phage shock protein A [Paenibacillus baekrokdamisoli]|uniref:Phage shock protein A n=1 Tax=Paenibacillus baekrokdamisoli TaxID=1712516 RepID=A0A3G9JFM9_9BACL|nr:PspA/IM30 family protein [Paenibacillus baekrokdamisoli]MBB3068098.1 phage shock protein A [Paenibacillus baekrokdamisoli]BBH22858.1 phage shock protein A [Paenibacillus baekrokdamisoli]